MVGSETARELAEIIKLELGQEKATKLLEALLLIEGSKSFRDSLRLVYSLLKGKENLVQ